MIAVFTWIGIAFAGLAVLAAFALAVFGLVRLYAFVLERWLAAKKLCELFRDFMWERMAPERKARK
ncbi:hypothetical protein DFP94_101514 [Fontibacillus phaseoli]|uniref:Uncharacterized protein n=1 Tax=Fontibacillus phaseoli TaxID=1416533 RepID=A0A369BPD1_9BACL|nr:hypothetical protein [Fontibacillus phaseoli]RCX22925.1 hypothetical protein DFP94_101514 [Fontibacillus phaseoli]